MVYKSDVAACLSFPCFDTVNSVQFYGAQAETAAKEAERLCLKHEQLFSAYRRDSDIWKINHAGGARVEVDAETARLLRRALDFCRLSKGRFDITIGAVSLSYHWKKMQALSDQQLQGRIGRIDFRQVEIKGNMVRVPPDVSIDLGGIAKGYTADRIAVLCREHGIRSALIDLGGNIYTIGGRATAEPWRIGIASPTEANKSFAVLEAKDISVVTSGLYERAFYKNERFYGHILDPKTGKTVNTAVLSATVIARSSTAADVLATMAFLMEPREILRMASAFDTDMVLLLSDESVIVSPGIQDRYGLRFCGDMLGKVSVGYGHE